MTTYTSQFGCAGTESVLVAFRANWHDIERHVSRQDGVEYFMKPDARVCGLQYPVFDGSDVRIYDCIDFMPDLYVVSVHSRDLGTALELASYVIRNSNGDELDVKNTVLRRLFFVEQRELAPRVRAVA